MPLPAPQQKTKPAKPEPGKIAIGFTLLLMAGIVVLVIWGVIALFSGHKSNTTKPAAKHQAAAAPAPKPKPQPTTAQKVSAWYSKYGSAITALENDFSQMGQAGTDPTAVGDVCTQIFNDATKAEADPSIPDTTANNYWASALNSYVNGAEDCQVGVANSDADQINKAAGEFQQGNSLLEKAAQTIQKLK